jgi:imidazolonepropionase-like amidohydrolase/Tol biopolymer transport system component
MHTLALSLALALAFQSNEAQKAEDKKEEPPKWDVNAPPGPSRDETIDVKAGTWMSVDVSPDGKELVFDLLGDVYLLPIAGGEAKAIASGVAWQMQPRWSPDGKRIAFTSDAGGGDNLWVMDRDGANARAVTKETFRLLNSPAWSPDGEYFAGHKHFTSRRSLGAGEIWLYHVATGGDGLQLTTKHSEQKDVGEPAFSPDGRYVYYSYDSTPGESFQYNKDPNEQIYAIDRLDRETGEIVTVVSGPGGACRPTPSPDGKALAFIRRVRYRSTLFLLDLASGAARPVWDGLERDMQETWAIHGVYPGIDWTSDGKELVLWARGKLWRVDVAGGSGVSPEVREIPFHVADTRKTFEAVRFPVEVAPEKFDVKLLRWVRVSPQGDMVVYQALGHLWARALPDGTPRRLTEDEDVFEFFPALARDGKALAYTTWNDEKLGSLRVLDLASGAVRTLTKVPGHYADPVFTPDGSELVFAKRTGGYITSPLWSSEPGIYRIPAAGGEPVMVSKEGTNPQFGADGKRVYLLKVGEEKDADRRELFSLELDGSDRRTHLVSQWATEYALSPDGEWVAFVERFNAYVAPFIPTGREVSIGPKSTAFPVAKVSRDAGENLQFSGDSRSLHWSLGPELYTRELRDAFAFLAGTPEKDVKLPEPPASGLNIAFQAPHAKPEGALALVGAKLVTMKESEVIDDGVIVVDGNRIAAVGRRKDVAIPAGAQVFDVKGTTIAPGLIDVHAHGGQANDGITPQSNWIHAANLAFGVTTIHDPSNDTNEIHAVAEMAKAGLVLSPRTFSTGTILYGAMGSFAAPIDSLDDARSHLRRLKAAGAISVKSYNQPRREQRQQVLAAAREIGINVVPEGGSLFQHNMTMVVDGHTGIEHSLPVEHVYDDVLQLWGPSGVGYTPTLVVGYGGPWGEEYFYQHENVWENERLARFVPRFVLDPRSRRRTMYPENEFNIRRSSGICRALLDAGGSVQLGAHGQLAGLAAHWELEMFTWGGMSAHEALRCGTMSGARYLGLDRDLGSLEPGKLADLFVCEGDALADVARTRDLRYTMLNGRLYDARTLAPVDGRGGDTPRFFWTDMQNGLPAQSTSAGCAACR